jgi:hypothetical protein
MGTKRKTKKKKIFFSAYQKNICETNFGNKIN